MVKSSTWGLEGAGSETTKFGTSEHHRTLLVHERIMQRWKRSLLIYWLSEACFYG